MTEYVLDVSKWRCGSDGDEAMGEGYTCMLNKEGFSCCLGHFAKQKGARMHSFPVDPRGVATAMDYPYDDNFCTKDGCIDNRINLYSNTPLAEELIYINDSPITTPREKVDLIRELLEKHGHTLKVLNEEMLDEGYRD